MYPLTILVDNFFSLQFQYFRLKAFLKRQIVLNTIYFLIEKSLNKFYACTLEF